jgi:two-component system, NtrC family, nitrogen regulation sensor histidine kinase GlnL
MNTIESDKESLVFAVDKRLRITSWGKELEAASRNYNHEVKGIHLSKVMPLIYTKAKDHILSVFESGKPVKLSEQKIICFCGRKKADIHITPQKDLNGRVSNVNVKTMLRNDSKSIVRLKQSERLLNIGKVAATLAHGVRSPLNAIKGCVIYIRENYDNEKELVEFSKIMEEEISRLDHFISSFLSTSISDKGLKGVNINKVLKKIAILISLQAQSRNCRTVIDYGHIATVMINSFHLEHAILNVIDNAMEAMPLGGLLSIKTFMKSILGNKFVTVEISDTGCGMKLKKHADVSVSSRKKGRGLGLFITREILQSNGGHLEITSDKGAGTTVKLFFPEINR